MTAVRSNLMGPPVSWEPPPGAAPLSRPPAPPSSAQNVRGADAVEVFHAPGALPEGPPPAMPTVTLGAGSRAASVPEPLYAAIRASLEARHLLVFGPDARDAGHAGALLGQLPPAQYRAALERLDAEGLLDKLAGALGEEGREAFLGQARAKGLIQQEPGAPRVGLFNPPGVPAMDVNDAALPRALRQAIHDGSVETARRYHSDYGQYIERYMEGVKSARSFDELRALGSPRERASVEPDAGVSLRHPDAERFRRDSLAETRHAGDPRVHAYRALAEKLSDLNGEARAGSFSVDLLWEVERRGVKSGAGLSLRQGGQVARELTSGAVVESGLPMGGAGKHGAGRAGVSQGVEVRAPEHGPRVVRSWGADTPLAGVTLDTEGTAELRIKVTSALAAYSAGNPGEGVLSGGVQGELESERLGAKVKARAAVSFHGLTSEDAAHALSAKPEGLFDVPGELAAGEPWSRLEPERQQALRRYQGYDEASWERALGARRAASR